MSQYNKCTLLSWLALYAFFHIGHSLFFPGNADFTVISLKRLHPVFPLRKHTLIGNNGSWEKLYSLYVSVACTVTVHCLRYQCVKFAKLSKSRYNKNTGCINLSHCKLCLFKSGQELIRRWLIWSFSSSGHLTGEEVLECHTVNSMCVPLPSCYRMYDCTHAMS